MADENGGRPQGYVLFLWSPTGYTLKEIEGEPPQIGDKVEDGDRVLVVTKLGPSPIPGDSRICAYSMGTS
jgi:hypothetical protein